jgi:molybdopterin/thiamine biosynthesis adenylyltransferase
MPLKTEELRKELQSRFLRIPWIAKGKLENLSVLIVGIGNLGSPVAYMLYGLGVKRLYLVDKDIVEASNLPRQMLFSISHLTKPKALVAAETLKAKFGDCVETKITPLAITVQDARISWNEIDVVFSCVDNPETRKFVLEKALGRGIPLVDMGLEEKEGQFGYALLVDREKYQEGACVDCYADFSGKSDSTPGCRVASAAPYTGMLIASAGLGMFVQHLMSHASGANFFYIDFNSMTSSFDFLKKRASCRTCGGKNA